MQVGLAQDGRVVRVTDDGERAVWADADERQVVALHLEGKTPHFVTSDGVAVYRVEESAKDGLWTSAVLDAKVPARFGELSYRARGLASLGDPLRQHGDARRQLVCLVRRERDARVPSRARARAFCRFA